MKIKEMKEKITSFANNNSEIVCFSAVYIVGTVAFALGIKAGHEMSDTKIINFNMISKENE